jgi:ribosomal protein S18 acetylase RimI-like enzyme
VTIRWSHCIDGVDWHELETLYRVAPLGIKPAAGLKTVFGNSRYCCFAYDGERLIGAGRALADGGDCSYLCDIAVLPGYQGSGVGREIVARLVELSKGHRKIILYAAPGKQPFYRRFGFRRMRTAMAIFDDQAQALAKGYVDED